MPDARPVVILVPGFLGSYLDSPGYFGFGGGHVWPDPQSLVTGGWHRLRLDVPAGVTRAPFGPALTPGQPVGPYYGIFIAVLRKRGWAVVLPDGDWRKSIGEDAARVADLCRALSSSAPLRIVCHSRGGLVTRKALQLLNGTGQIGLVSRVVSLGTPHTGALEAVSYLACWGDTKRQLADLGRWVPRPVSDFLGIRAVNEVLRSWPGLYELLPKPGAPWLPLNPPDLLYRAETYAGSAFDPPQSLLDAAKANWANLPDPPAGVDWICIAGRGVPTALGIPDAAKITERGNFKVSTDGDGPVPYASARLAGRKTLTHPTEHNTMPLDGRLMAWVDAILREGLDADREAGGQLLWLTV